MSPEWASADAHSALTHFQFRSYGDMTSNAALCFWASSWPTLSFYLAFWRVCQARAIVKQTAVA